MRPPQAEFPTDKTAYPTLYCYLFSKQSGNDLPLVGLFQDCDVGSVGIQSWKVESKHETKKCLSAVHKPKFAHRSVQMTAAFKIAKDF